MPVGVVASERAFDARHRVVLRVLAVHLPVLFLVGWWWGESLGHLVTELTVLGGVALAASSRRLSRPWRTGLATTALVGCSALLVHVTGGLTESHFHFFAVVALVTLYQRWLPYLLCIGWVVLHHGVVGQLAPQRVFVHEAAIARPALWALIHGGFVVLASLASLAAWRASERERFRAEDVLAAAPRPIYGVDRAGRVLFVNQALTELLDVPADELVGRHVHELLHLPAGDCLPCRLTLSGGEHHLDHVELRRPGGGVFPAELHVRPVHERGHHTGAVVSHWDISNRLAQQRQLEHLALHDDLTGLANRSLLKDRLEQALCGATQTGHRVAVAFVDLDRFKPVNDVLGHAAGDELLLAVARRLRSSVKEQDTVARVGGDEFVVVAAGIVDQAGAAALGDRLATALVRPLELRGQQLLVSASIGVRLSDPGDLDADRLIADADLAMFAAKVTGSGKVVHYTGHMRADADRAVTLGAELQGAVERDELVLRFQPIWPVGASTPDGLEVLVRWNHPTLGLLGPDRFVAVAERTGTIGAIGHWVLREAVSQLAAWRTELGPAADELHVAVNLSVRQLQDPTLVDEVAAMLGDAGVPADRLYLEVTESLLVREGDRAGATLHRLRELGVTLSIDDFGTGYSSLATLQRLPVQQLKIDRSFVLGLGDDPSRLPFVRAIVGLADALDLDVVAEGVESDADLQAVAALGCAHAQGFGLGRPVPARDVPALLTQRVPAELAPVVPAS
ncbi:putative bifunctional diguanylate cyclase/phosphodiesterase [Egicoccus halophilus]|uniref:PAS domain S-box-containing protein/diguanylate cyclase (GGDEF) domain-containing protein n=1 Tax=Egicoccus halophilus TaxID=1670830 RepID=A0A8J3AFH7_9ACTN|nr:EAL domain-containing protein [Egicoccus halophilus]GGI06787.1 hypothetical protein GCM10011354_20840 [Egicoccus halophilus]